MSSFINLLGSDVWSEADIVNRTESMLRSEVSVAAEGILNRKIQGAMLGQYTLSLQEQAEIGHFAQITAMAQQAGEAARADMALLRNTLMLEAAQRRLLQPEAIDDAADALARLAAQATIDAASPDVLALAALRNPQVQP